MATSTDADDAPRRALAGMLSRLTADRDALLAALQACEERIAALGSRVAALEAALGSKHPEPAPDPRPGRPR
jgi:hypothetical protein